MKYLYLTDIWAYVQDLEEKEQVTNILALLEAVDIINLSITDKSGKNI